MYSQYKNYSFYSNHSFNPLIATLIFSSLCASSFPLIFMRMDTLPLAHHLVVCMACRPVSKTMWMGKMCACMCGNEDHIELKGAIKIGTFKTTHKQ